MYLKINRQQNFLNVAYLADNNPNYDAMIK